MKEIYKWRFHNEYKMIANSVFKERLKTFCIVSLDYSAYWMRVKAVLNEVFFTSSRLAGTLNSVKKYHQLLRSHW